MKRNYFTIVISIFIISVCALGLVLKGDIDPRGSKTNSSSKGVVQHHEPVITDNVILFTDNMDGDNTEAGLQARGYKTYNRSQPVGTTGWFQGNDIVFVAYNGPTTGYVAANFNNTGNNGNIDNWLILPRVTGGGISAGDSLYFWSRSTNAASQNYPDSIRVMYTVSDSVPEGTWTELGRFKLQNPQPSDPNNGYIRRGFMAPTASANGRFAIRYNVVDGGLLGNNSDYIGIDALSIERNLIGIKNPGNQTPSSFKLGQNYPNPFNPSTHISYSIPKAGNVKIEIFDVLGNKVAVVLNEFQQAGNYDINYDASKLSSGLYFYKMFSGSFNDTKKMILVK